MTAYSVQEYVERERVHTVRVWVCSAKRADEVASQVARCPQVRCVETLRAEQGAVEYAWIQAATALLSLLFGGAP